MRAIACLLLLISSDAIAGPRGEAASAAEYRWQDCVVAAAKRGAGKATAETVVEAAFSRCSTEETDFREKMAEWSRPFGIGSRLPPEELDRQVDIQRRRIRGEAIGAILGM